MILKTIMTMTDEKRVDEFETYIAEAKLLLETSYPWKKWSPTIHKILLHTIDFIRKFGRMLFGGGS